MKKLLVSTIVLFSSIQMAFADNADSEKVYSLAVVQPPPPIIDNQQWAGHFSYAVGYKRLESKWGSARDRIDVGVLDIDIRPPQSPISLVGQALISYSGDVPSAAGAPGDYSATYGLNLGLRKVFENPSPFQPFINGGLALISASARSKLDAAGLRHEDSSMNAGVWGGGGVYWNLTPDFHLGLAAQYTHAQVHLFNEKSNAGGFEVLLLVGYHW